MVGTEWADMGGHIAPRPGHARALVRPQMGAEAAHKLTHGRTAREINGDAGFVCRMSVCELKSNG